MKIPKTDRQVSSAFEETAVDQRVKNRRVGHRTMALCAALVLTLTFASCTSPASVQTNPSDSSAVSAVSTDTPAEDTAKRFDWNSAEVNQTIIERMKQEAKENGGKIELKMWCNGNDRDFEQSLADAFTARFADIDYTIEIKIVGKGEADAAAAVIEFPKKAADVFSYRDDTLYDLRQVDAIAEVLPFFAQNVREENSEASIAAASDGDVLYAFPKTSDYGYFLYYDKRVLSEEDVGQMDTMIQKAAAADKNVFMDFGNSWYSASFFLTAGVQFGKKDGRPHADYDMTQILSAVNAMCHIAQNEEKGFVGLSGQLGDDAYIEQAFQKNTLAAAVTGTWMIPAIKKAIGAENLGAAKLPTVLMDGEQKQLQSFSGYKMIGVSAYSKCPFSAQTLAYFLGCEENQFRRYTEQSAIPTNLQAAASEIVTADPVYQAIEAQRPYAHTSANGLWFYPFSSIGAEVVRVKGQTSDEKIQQYWETFQSGMADPTL